MNKKRKTRIPYGIFKCHTFLNQTSTYLSANTNANGLRLGLTAAEITQWVAFNTTDGLYYPAWSNPSSRTSDLTHNLKLNISNLRAFNKANKILDRIAASLAATVLDLETFNINSTSILKSSAVIPKANITDNVVVNIVYLGGGRLQYNCRPNQTAKRSHIAEDADRLEVRVKLGDPAPTSADNTDAQWVLLSSKATVTQDFGSANVGKRAYLYFRWADSKRPHRNGPWTAMMNVIIP